MSVSIDEPRSYQLTGNIDGFPRFCRRNIFRHGRDHTVGECDVVVAATVIAGIDDFAVFEQQLVFESHAAPAFWSRVITKNHSAFNAHALIRPAARVKTINKYETGLQKILVIAPQLWNLQSQQNSFAKIWRMQPWQKTERLICPLRGIVTSSTGYRYISGKKAFVSS